MGKKCKHKAKHREYPSSLRTLESGKLIEVIENTCLKCGKVLDVIEI